MICTLVLKNGRRDSLVYLRVTNVITLLRLVEQAVETGPWTHIEISKIREELGPSHPYALSPGPRWLIANDYRFFSATNYSTNELSVKSWEETVGIFPASGTRALTRAPGATLRNRAGNLLRIRSSEHMKRVEAKVIENRKEDPASEPDQDPNTWLIEGKLDEDILDWETVRLDFRFSEIDAEIVESSMSKPNHFTVRTRGKSPLQKDDVIHCDIRNQNES